MPNEQSITKELNAVNSWTYEEIMLPKYNTTTGEKIEYIVTEKEKEPGNLEYYNTADIQKAETEVDEVTHYTYTITNSYKLTQTDLNISVTKTGTEEITAKDQKVNYTINLQAEIAEYIGEGKVKIVDTLPYAIDKNKSDLNGGVYDSENKTITWEIELKHFNTDTGENKNKNDVGTMIENTNSNVGEGSTSPNGKIFAINITKQISVVYTDIDLEEEKMTNTVKGKIELSDTSEEDEKVATADTAINVQGKVIVRYVDIDTNKDIVKVDKEGNIQENENYNYEITGKIGTAYTTQEKEIDKYIFVKAINATGKIKEKDQEAIYYYESAKTRVIVKYQDTDGNNILEEEIIEGYVGDTYKVEQKEIEGYKYVETRGEAEGTMTKDEIVITYVYQKASEGKLIVKYVDIDTNEDIIVVDDTNEKVVEASTTNPIAEASNTNSIAGESNTISIVGASIARPKGGTYSYEITGEIGEDYKTEKLQIPYYVYVKDSGNTEGKLEEETTVIYYYRKMNFNFSVEKTISSITVNGEKMKITDNKVAKVEVKTKEIDTTDIIIKYNIKVTNEGELKGKAKVLEILPKGYELVESSEEWKTAEDGTLESEIELEAEESKNLSIQLKWMNDEENLGAKANIAKISNTSNLAEYGDTDKEDNTSEATIVVSIKTGVVVSIIIISLIISSLGICGYIIVKTVRGMKDGSDIKTIRFLMKK